MGKTIHTALHVVTCYIVLLCQMTKDCFITCAWLSYNYDCYSQNHLCMVVDVIQVKVLLRWGLKLIVNWSRVTTD